MVVPPNLDHSGLDLGLVVRDVNQTVHHRLRFSDRVEPEVWLPLFLGHHRVEVVVCDAGPCRRIQFFWQTAKALRFRTQ